MQLTGIARNLTLLAALTGSLTLSAGVPHGATLSGYVKDSGAGDAGIPGVTVIARNDGKTVVGRFDSVDRGFYSLKDLPTGKELHLSYERLGYGTVQDTRTLAADQSFDVWMAKDDAPAAYYNHVAFKISSGFSGRASTEAIAKEVQKLGLPLAKGELVKTRIAALQGFPLSPLQSPRDKQASKQTGTANEWDTAGHAQKDRERHDQATNREPPDQATTTTSTEKTATTKTARATVASVGVDEKSFAVHSKDGTDRTFKTNHDTAVSVGGTNGRLSDLKQGDRVIVVYKIDGAANVATKVRVSKPAAAAPAAAKAPAKSTG